MLWNILREKMSEHPLSQFESGEKLENYETVLEQVEEKARLLKQYASKKSKCILLCNDAFYMAKGVLTCFCADLIPIPLSIFYGRAHCNKIIQLVQPDLVLIDDEQCTWEEIKDIPSFNLVSHQWNGNKVQKDYEPCLEDVALMMCTSGTTGSPKGVMITEEGLLQNIQDIDRYFKIGHEDKILIARPMYHCAVLTGEFLISVYKGINIYFFNEKYNPMTLVNLVQEQNITVMGGTPTLFGHFATFVKRRNTELTLCAIAISGECLTKVAAEKIRTALPDIDIYNVYGLTEASPRATYLSPNLFDSYPESVGKPLFSVETKIVDKNNVEVPYGTDGELLLRGKNIMKGYYKNEELTKKTIEDGWLHTHDIACMSEEGLIFIKSRADDMIIKAGMNIYPKEIENVLKDRVEIVDVLAYGIQTPLGQNIGVDIVLSEDYQMLGVKEIFEICSECLPVYLFPDKIQVVNSIEKNASGKVIRRKDRS